MSYVLDCPEESQRLEAQSTLPTYDPASEFAGVTLPQGATVLDAGCGTGIAARWLKRAFPSARVEGCDLSNLRLAEARKQACVSGLGDIRFYESPLEAIEAKAETYDFISCRYVFEHVRDARAVAKEFLRVLKPGGTACVIDFDGLLYNLFPATPELRAMLREIERRYSVDMFIGRKIPQILTDAGFRDVTWTVRAHAIQGEELEAERDITEKRFIFAREALRETLGRERVQEFCERYLDEMVRPGSTLFYNKFVVQGRK